MTEDRSSPRVDDLGALRRLTQEAPDRTLMHAVGVREVVRGPGALSSLASIIARFGLETTASIVVLSDTAPKGYRGEDVLATVRANLVGSLGVHEVLVAPKAPATIVHADESTIAETVRRIGALAPSLLLTVGSGTMADVGKIVAKDLDLPHVVVQSAASVNGFADDQSVLLINGAKRTTPSRWPDVLVIDTALLAEAPPAMNRSGLGDQLSMFTAAADWYLSSAVGFDATYSQTLVDLMRRDFDQLAARATEIGNGNPEAVGVLASFLTNGGLAMGIAGRTAPSSGTEHVISHLLEMHADAEDVPSSSHGSTVGVASVLALLAWQSVRDRLCRGSVELTAPGDDVRQRVSGAFGHLDDSGATARECWTAYERKLVWIHEHLRDIERIVGDWPVHDEVMDRLLVPAGYVASVLRSAGAPVHFDELAPPPDSDVVSWAVRNCHLMRDRFTVVDLADLLGVWNETDVASLLHAHEELAR